MPTWQLGFLCCISVGGLALAVTDAGAMIDDLLIFILVVWCRMDIEVKRSSNHNNRDRGSPEEA